jgi:hypothetical protein
VSGDACVAMQDVRLITVAWPTDDGLHVPCTWPPFLQETYIAHGKMA